MAQNQEETKRQELILRALLAAENIGVEYADADEAWESLFNAIGDEPDFAAADKAFAEAVGQLDLYID